ncbi:hypothetical protein AB670_03842 [Chryseobacterium sp. MOF25P]|uniref:hypothetical protein n=1 Tax=unclassified Chryseobacterium TaxID=2593645 RepID=UPI000805DE34|nr:MULTISPECIES: hypothetical protein [unclassified Chryseobacterium]OBW39799.1 hypothetical protein AB670_03842 [Chryseobacterium sp. MOF25P]OBW44961.1 hypothetical protein AB671_02981 [Chryseobacterium sp. BGARF1]
MKDFDLDNLERQNIYAVPENMFKNIQDKVLSGVKDFDLENLERKNIYKVSENIFEDIQEKVLSRVQGFDLEKLERQNIYAVPENMFENIQNRVMGEIKTERKAPIFKMNWGYAAAASLALIFGSTFVYNLNSDSSTNGDSNLNYTDNRTAPKKESQLAYETLESDLTSIENPNQRTEKQMNIKSIVSKVANNDSEKKNKKTVKTVNEIHMNEYLESLNNSEIAELANNSSQDVYLDLYN